MKRSFSQTFFLQSPGFSSNWEGLKLDVIFYLFIYFLAGNRVSQSPRILPLRCQMSFSVLLKVLNFCFCVFAAFLGKAESGTVHQMVF